MGKRKFNGYVVSLSLLGLVCLVLTFLLHWSFIIPAAVFSGLGWRDLLKK